MDCYKYKDIQVKKNMDNQLYAALARLLRLNSIHVNQEELKLQLLTHPSYPSLHALTGVLNHFSINNLAIRVPISSETIPELPTSFIAHLDLEEGDNLCLVEQKRGRFKVRQDENKTIVLTEEAFLAAWNGVVLVAEKDEQTKAQQLPKLATAINWAFYLFTGLALAYLVYFNADQFSAIHFGLSLIGLIVAVFIVRHELGLQSAATTSVCNLSEQTSCEAVLNSKGANLFGLIKLSDLSVITFVAFALTWILYFLSGTTDFTFLALLTLASCPFVLYSIYYQYAVVKKWCPLCLGIATILILQTVTLPFYNWSVTAVTFNSVSLFVASFFIAAYTWDKYASLLRKKILLEKTELQHYKFKRNFSLFNAVYSEKKQIQTSIAIQNEIVLGNADAVLELILVTNPRCFFCKKSHQEIAMLLEATEEQLKVIIRFNIGALEQENSSYQVANQLLHIYNTKGLKACKEALEEVYSEDVDLNKWLRKQLPPSHNYDTILLEQQAWCKDNAINFTPDLSLNNKKYPEEYSVTDLVYFIDGLIEQEELNKSKQMARLFAI